jgi:hypothetical protein
MYARVALLFVTSVVGLLSGAAVVHAVMKPDLTLPDLNTPE